jgi:hypothetical protein
MAQKVQVMLVDDLDGSAADETVTFGLDGAKFEIDLTAAHAAELRSALAPWIRAGRKTSSRTASRGRSSGGDVSKIRAWAKSHGYQVSERGRIPANIRDAYNAAH